MSISQELTWSLLKKHNSFLVRRNGVKFSSEPGNLKNLHKFKYSGLANKKVIDVQPNGKDKGVVVSRKTPRASKARRPSQAFQKIVLKHHFRNNARSLSNLIRYYRPDLKHAAVARLSQLNRVRTLTSKKRRNLLRKH